MGGALKAAGAPYGVDRYLVARAAGTRGWMTARGAAGAIAIAYFLGTRLGPALISASSHLAVFWPASGVTAGILIVLGGCALPALIIGVVVGTAAANLTSNSSLVTCLLNGSCNAGEAVPPAWPLEGWFGRPFNSVDPRRVAGLLAAGSSATAASAFPPPRQ